MLFRQLFPEAGEVAIGDYVGGFGLHERAPADRPYTVSNFVSSLDGRASAQGTSGGLGDDGDKALFRALRDTVDAILVGTGTLAAENYGRLIPDEQRREQRRAAGLSAEPLACVLSRSGRLPLEIPLFAEPEARVIVFSAQAVELTGVRAQVELVRLDPAQLSFATALGHLRGEHGVRALLCEGGPTVLGALLAEGVADELCLTLAGKLIGGGEASPITAGPELPVLADARLAGVLERHGTLFLRYQRQF